jgi:ABC-type uncharacterized transport system involved in gliding motility auxiliary subunit
VQGEAPATPGGAASAGAPPAGAAPKVPATCDAIAIVGPTRPYFAPEAQAIREYLDGGGRAFVALDLEVKAGAEMAPEVAKLLEAWHVRVQPAMIVDPISGRLGLDASVAVVTGSKEHPITKDAQTAIFFPFARPLEILPGAPEGMTATWIARTTPGSWSMSDFKALGSGRVEYKEGRDKRGPHDTAIAVEGKSSKDSKATRKTRLVVLGTSMPGNNSYSRLGGNLDFALNAISWVMEDESLISIRPKEEAAGKVELSQKQGTVIGLLTVFVVPALIAVAGIVIWVLRRRL